MTSDINPAPLPDKRRKRILVVLLLVAVLAMALWAGAWLATARWLEGRIGSLVEEERGRGHQVFYSDLRVEGFPFAMSVLVTGLVYGREHGDGALSVSAGRLRADVRPGTFSNPVLRAESALALRWHDHGRDRVSTVSAAPGTRLDLRFHASGQLAGGQLDMPSGLLVSGREGQEVEDLARFASARIGFGQAEKVTDHTGAAAILDLAVSGLDVPRLVQFLPDAGREAGDLTLGMTLRGVLEGTEAEAFALWRDSGGTLDIDSFTFAAGPLGLHLDATLAPDRLLRPEGAGMLELRGAEAVIRDLVASGRLAPERAEIAKLVLGAFSHESDGARLVRLPVAIQDGYVSAGPVTLFRLPPL